MLTKHKLAPSYGDATDLLATSGAIICDGSFLVKREPDLLLDSGSECGQSTRKRQRLDHLSQEEKVLRRKLKNRVAAQCARDRKKVVMDTLEDEVNSLKSMVKKLESSNQQIQKDNTELQRKNEELEAKLAEIQSQKCSCVTRSEGENRSIKHAEWKEPIFDLDIDVDLDCIDDVGSEQMQDILEELEQFLKAENFAPPDENEQQAISEKQLEPEMVGTSAEQLESVKDLVHFDHIYHKSEPPTPDTHQNLAAAESAFSSLETSTSCPVYFENEMPEIFEQDTCDDDDDVTDEVVIETESCEISSSWQQEDLLHRLNAIVQVPDGEDDDVMIVDELRSSNSRLALSSVGNQPNLNNKGAAKATLSTPPHNHHHHQKQQKQNIVDSSLTNYDVASLLGVSSSYLDADSDYESGGSSTMSHRGDDEEDGSVSPIPSFTDDGIDALRELFPVLI